MTRRHVVRAMTALGVAGCGFLALVGGVVLHGTYLLIPLVLAALAGCVACGVQEEGGKPAAVAGLTAAGGTAAIAMVVTGVGVLAGTGVAVTCTLAAAGAAALGWLLKAMRRRSAGATVIAPVRSAPAVPEPLPGRPDRSPLPVSLLPTRVLCGEWVRTTAALAGRLAPVERQEIVRRRAEALDELERRDPSGFASWLTADRSLHSDPTAFMRGPARSEEQP
jgi:hypothetical protein